MTTDEHCVPQRGAVRKPFCSQCGVRKTDENTGLRYDPKVNRVYFHGVCKKCNAKGTRSWHLRDIKGSLLAGAKSRAKRAGLPFNITREDIHVPEYCPVFGIPLIIEVGARTDNSPTLDKVHNEMGYVRGNVVVVSWKANRLKNNATVGELQQLASFYLQHLEQDWMKP